MANYCTDCGSEVNLNAKISYCYDLSKDQYYLATIGSGSDWSIEVQEER